MLASVAVVAVGHLLGDPAVKLSGGVLGLAVALLYLACVAWKDCCRAEERVLLVLLDEIRGQLELIGRRLNAPIEVSVKSDQDEP